VLLSPTNQVLLLHRVQTSTAFPSAHVFPGGNLSQFHEGSIAPPEAPECHQDSRAYRLAAIRETFEESGILLAKKKGQPGLLEIDDEKRELGRRQVHNNEVKFADLVEKWGGIPDMDGLLPFTRWITPLATPRRFTTQMYLYMLPLDDSTPLPEFEGSPKGAAATPQAANENQRNMIPRHDGGLEHTAAEFGQAESWLVKAKSNKIVLFPPQFYLLHLVSEFTTVDKTRETSMGHQQYQTQRDGLISFLARTPTTRPGSDKSTASETRPHPTSVIPWAEKVMSPRFLVPGAADGRMIFGVDRPGPELQDSGRGGDYERVLLLRFDRGVTSDMDIYWRDEVVRAVKEKGSEQAKKPKI
jgi:8-oxo-dGTP pyrophosphatase MutT (NUDIX family)